MSKSEKSPRPEPVLSERERVVLQSYLNRNPEQIPYCPKGKRVYILSSRNIERLEEEFVALKDRQASSQLGQDQLRSKPNSKKAMKITFSRCRRLEREDNVWCEVAHSIKRSGIRAFNIVGEGVLLVVNVPECILKSANLMIQTVNAKLERFNRRLSRRSVELRTWKVQGQTSSDLERLCRRIGLSPHDVEVEICRLAQEKNRKKVEEWSAGCRSDSDADIAEVELELELDESDNKSEEIPHPVSM